MTGNDWLIQILLGGLMGIIGQGMRTIVGLKKTYDEAREAKVAFRDNFQTSVFVTSIFTGFVVGAGATFAISDDLGKLEMTKDTLLGLAAAGYGGVDFVEGFVKKYIPQG